MRLTTFGGSNSWESGSAPRGRELSLNSALWRISCKRHVRSLAFLSRRPWRLSLVRAAAAVFLLMRPVLMPQVLAPRNSAQAIPASRRPSQSTPRPWSTRFSPSFSSASTARGSSPSATRRTRKPRCRGRETTSSGTRVDLRPTTITGTAPAATTKTSTGCLARQPSRRAFPEPRPTGARPRVAIRRRPWSPTAIPRRDGCPTPIPRFPRRNGFTSTSAPRRQ